MSATKERRKSPRVVAIDGNFVLERPLHCPAALRLGPLALGTVAWIPPTSEAVLASSTRSNVTRKSTQLADDTSQPHHCTPKVAPSSSPPASTEHLAASWQQHGGLSWAQPGDSEELLTSNAPTTHTGRTVDKTVSWTAIGASTDEQTTGGLTRTATTTTMATTTHKSLMGASLMGNSLHLTGSASFNGGGAFANFLSMSLVQSSAMMSGAFGGNGMMTATAGMGYIAYHDEQEGNAMTVKAFLGRDCSSNERVVVWVQQLPRVVASNAKFQPDMSGKGGRSPMLTSPLPAALLGAPQHHHRTSSATTHSTVSGDRLGTTRGIVHVMGTNLKALLRVKSPHPSTLDAGAASTAAAAEVPTFIPGIPRMLYFDTEKDDRFHCLVQPALGPTLLSLIKYCGGSLSVRSVVMLGIQLLQLLKHCAGCSFGKGADTPGGITLNDMSPSSLRFGASSVDSHVVYMTSFAHCAAVGSAGTLPHKASVPPARSNVTASSAPRATHTTTTTTIPPTIGSLSAAAAAEGNPMTPGQTPMLFPPPTLVVDDVSGGSNMSVAALFTADPLNISAVSHNSHQPSISSEMSPVAGLSTLGSSFVSAVTQDQCKLVREYNLAFGSARHHLGMPLSLADDAESIAYILVYCLTGSLPWLANHLLLTVEDSGGSSPSSSTAHFTPNGALMQQFAREAEFIAAHPTAGSSQPLSQSTRASGRSPAPSASDVFARHLFRIKEHFTTHSTTTASLPLPLVHLLSTTQLLAKAASQEVCGTALGTLQQSVLTSSTATAPPTSAAALLSALSSPSSSAAVPLASVRPERSAPGIGGSLSTSELLQDCITVFRDFYAKSFPGAPVDYIFDWNRRK